MEKSNNTTPDLNKHMPHVVLKQGTAAGALVVFVLLLARNQLMQKVELCVFVLPVCNWLQKGVC